MKIPPVRAELFHAGGRADGRTGGRADGQTDIAKLKVAFRNLANAPKISSNINAKLKQGNRVEIA